MFLLTLACSIALIVCAVNLFYVAAIRFTSGERLRDIILQFQVVMSVGVFVGYQFLPRLMDMKAASARACRLGPLGTGPPGTWDSPGLPPQPDRRRPMPRNETHARGRVSLALMVRAVYYGCRPLTADAGRGRHGLPDADRRFRSCGGRVWTLWARKAGFPGVCGMAAPECVGG
ncbi:MAG: hypothetical protein HGB17_15710 [Syntrophobacteraceae bacterium]|nr:hypothetical protein [Syntrophobacteraceae bacterium]